MIGKLIENPDATASKAARISGLLRYIAQPELDGGGEKCIRYSARNFFSKSLNGHILEMIELASCATRSADPIEHFMLSWPEGEQPTPDQADGAVDILLDQMRLQEHQVAWGLHVDTDTLHLHIVVNRVHPVSERPVKINKGFTREALHQALARIELAQGWAPEDGARYEIEPGGTLVRREATSEPSLSAQARAFETRTGEASAQRNAQELVSDIVEQATNWGDLHRRMERVGLRYERKGSGALIWVGEQPIKASSASRGASLAKLQARLGPFEPHSQEMPNVYFTHEVEEPGAGRIGELSRNGMRNLSECRLAYREDKGSRKAAGVLSLDARAYRSGNEGVRRPPQPDDGALHVIGVAAVKPVAPQASRQWSEYQTERDAFFANRKRAQERARTEQQDRREALRLRQREERDEIFRGSWKGRGAVLNALRSVTAAHQAAEKADLIDKEREEREALRTKYGASFPDYETWLRTNVGDEAAQGWRHRDSKDEAVLESSDPRISQEAASTRPRDIRDCRSRRTSAGTVYTLKGNLFSSFIDTGKSVILRRKDDTSVVAALQLAQQKFGPVHIRQSFFSLGRRKFEAQCVRLAAEHQIRLADPKLQERAAQLRRELTAHEQAYSKSAQALAFDRFAKAVDAERYRVTSVRSLPEGLEQAFAVGETRTSPRGLTTSQIAVTMPNMIALMKKGETLHYTPISSTKHHIVVDGLSQTSLDRLLADGYRPAVVVRNAPDKFQAILTIEKLETDHDADVANGLSQLLNQEYGTKPERMSLYAVNAPGFTNLRDTHGQPLDSTVGLIFAEKRTCQKLLERSQHLASRRSQQNQPPGPDKKAPAHAAKVSANGLDNNQPSASAYRAHRADILNRQIGTIDESRVDFMIAQRMRVTGHSRDAIRAAIEAGARASRPGSVPAVGWARYATRATDSAFTPKSGKKLSDLGVHEKAWRELEGRTVRPGMPRTTGRPGIGE